MIDFTRSHVLPYYGKQVHGLTRWMPRHKMLEVHSVLLCLILHNPAGIYLLNVSNRNTRARCEICSLLTIKTPEQRQWRRSGVVTDNIEHISHLVLVFLLLTYNMQWPDGN